jgi:hypothetical protein
MGLSGPLINSYILTIKMYIMQHIRLLSPMSVALLVALVQESARVGHHLY